MEIGAWLESQGLGRHAAAFEAADIGMDILPSLTDADLMELGLSLGDRKRLSKAIGALGTAHIQVEIPLASSPRREAERRQLTVMFVDLVGSTALSTRLDPEEMGEVLKAYQNAVTGEISRLDGFTAKLMGDGVLAYFGWPKAHEDEAERAVRAGLAIVQAVARLPAPQALACRVGIATGLVVVGDLIGEGAAQEEAVVGDTPNLAARLQGLAEPGQVVVAAATRRLLGAGFAVERIGPQTLKGLAAPVEAFRIIGERAVESRFAARSGETVLPMVGRDEELALLLRQWREVLTGEGRSVMVVGEAGIGKSRLVRALREAVLPDRPTVLLYQCSPFHTDSPLWPVTQQLAFAARFEPGDDATTKLGKLRAILDEDEQDLPLLASLLDIPLDPDPLADLVPQERRQRTLGALVSQLRSLARKGPILVLLEDVHWLDPSTTELQHRTLDAIVAAPVLLLLTSRPEAEPELGRYPHLSRLALHRLGRAAVDAIMTHLTAKGALTAGMRTAILERTDGVPLFVEELTRAMLEADPTGEGVAVPATLQDSLLARLDRDPSMSTVAQIAACIGREFDHPLLAEVAQLGPHDLAQGLTALVRAELIYRRGMPPDANYSFKHALIRDIAYESLLKTRRRELHGRISAALEARGGAIELQAWHAQAAGAAERAIELWRQAGRLAVRRFANAEAIRHFRSALRLLTESPDHKETDSTELSILIELGVPLIAATGYASDEVYGVHARARSLADGREDREQLFAVLRGLWNCVYDRGQLLEALELASQLVDLADRAGKPEQRALALRALGSTRLRRGELELAAHAFREGLEVCEGLPLDVGVRAHGECPRVVCQQYLGNTLVFCGLADQGRELGLAAVEQARQLDHPISLAFALGILAVALALRREPDACAEAEEEMATLSARYRVPFWAAQAEMLLGWARAQRADDPGALEQILQGLRRWRETGAELFVPGWSAIYGEAAQAVGRHPQAKPVIEEGIRLARAHGELEYLADLERQRGLIALALGSEASAEIALVSALEIAREQGARWWELRAARDLARLWAEQGERQKAHDLLAPVYGWFTEGLDLPDLVEAKALLGELA